MFLDGFTPYKKEDADKYQKFRWWAGLTFGDIIDKAADIYPDKEALVDNVSRLTYSQVREKADKLAVGLMGLGIQPQDRVLLQLPNWNEFVISYFALQKTGAIPIILIARYGLREINHICSQTGAIAWIVAEKYQKIDYLPIIKDVLKTNPQTKQVLLARATEDQPFTTLESLLENADLTAENLEKLAARRPDPLQVAHMGTTGGTTGLAKVAPHTHNNYLCKVEYAARAWELGQDDTCLIAAPAAHDLIFSAGICSAIFSFGKLVMLDTTDIPSICQKIQNEKVTAAVWVPTLALRLAEFKDLKDYDLSSLKKMHCGGGASSPHLIKAVNERLGCIYMNGYGGTEGMLTVTRMSYDVDYTGKTVGKPGCPYDSYKILDDHDRVQPVNTAGELVVKGPSIFTGYYKSPEENEKAFTAEGYFRTGDQAMINEAGDIFITGRLRDIIKRGGESISAVEIENLISSHPEVQEIAVIGMPDPVMGERICAYIKQFPGGDLSFEKIINYLKSQNASVLQLPERIEFVEAMLYTEAGKLNKRALQQDIIKKIEEES